MLVIPYVDNADRLFFKRKPGKTIVTVILRGHLLQLKQFYWDVHVT